MSMCYFESDLNNKNVEKIKSKIEKFLYTHPLDAYDFINIKMM